MILVTDCQNDIVHENGKMAAMNNGTMATIIKQENVLGVIARLAAAGIPIIHVRHAYRPDYLDLPQNAPLLRGARKAESLKDGAWGAEIHQAVAPQPGAITITRTRVSALYASPPEAILSAQSITHLVLTAIATDGVVEGTARDAVDRGYYVTLAEDCCATFSDEAHRVALPGEMLTTVCTADEVIAAAPS